MRIALLIRALDVGGAEAQLVLLAKGLAVRGHEVAVLCFYGGGPLESELQVPGVTLYDLAKRGRKELLRFELRLIKQLRKFRPDVIHGFQGPPNIMAMFARPFVPGMKVVWGLRASNMDLSLYDYSRRVVFSLTRKLSRFADLIVANSKNGQEYHVRQGFAANRMMTISNGIDTERFEPDPAAGASVRQGWGIAEGERLIGLVARLDTKKDHGTFLQAAALLLEHNPEVRFVCVGGGSTARMEELERMAATLDLTDKLIWAGERSDMPAVLNALDVNTLASAYGEGFPNSIGESMATGVPCVATDTGDVADIVADTGNAVSPGDAKKMAECWNSLLSLDSDERQILASKCRARIVDMYSVDAMVEASVRAYQRIID
jgi:glycosyltransferase involved in cell wall biosynthesis